MIDQTVGAAINTVAFIMTMGLLRGQDFEVIKAQIHNVSSLLLLPFFATIVRLAGSDAPTGLLAHHACWIQALALCVDSQLYGCTRRQAIACWKSVWRHLGGLSESDVWVIWISAIVGPHALDRQE